MKRVNLHVTSLIAAAAITACAARTPAPQPAPMPSSIAQVAPEASPSSASAPRASSGNAVMAEWVGKPAPATQPGSGSTELDQSLPAGHPNIQQLIAQQKAKARMNGELPAGHPPIAGRAPAAAASAPTTPTAPTAPAAPNGNLATMWAKGAVASATASTKPAAAATTGSIAVLAVQGTADGPAIGEVPVIVELHQDGQLIDRIEGKTAADGSLKLDNLPLNMAIMPVVKVTYEGVEYTAPAASVIDAEHATQSVQVPVFQTTEQKPAWTVSMQHVMLEPTIAGMDVTEMLAIENPSDRAWIGTPGAAGADGKAAKRRTLSFPLPAGAQNVRLGGGLHDCCTSTEGGAVQDSMALVPGVSQYRISYTLPVTSGNAQLAFSAIAPVKHLMVFVPDDGSTVKAEGIGDGGVSSMGGGKTRFYRAADVAAGTAVKLSLSGITATAPAAADSQGAGAVGLRSSSSAAASRSSAQRAKLIAGAGGLTIFVVGGMLLMFKAPRAKKS